MRFANLWLVLLGLWACSVDVRADWQPVTIELLKAEKPAYGGLCGVVVDPRTGNVIVNVSERGFYQSDDQGKTWKRLGAQVIKGRTEWPGCLMIDPVGGKTIASALVYGSPIVLSKDGGQTWKVLDMKSGHVDWFALDWSDPEHQWIYALKHESGDLLLRSTDGGKSFEEVGKGYGPAWIFDAKTAVVAEAKSKTKPNPGLLRTTDGGKTYQPCGAYHARALPRWHAGALYWLVDGALLSTTDKGETWNKIASIKDGRFGPVFGKDKQMFVLTSAGILESTNGGSDWSQPIAVPKDLKGVSALTWLAFDPVHEVLYVMKMTSELYKLDRKK